MKALIDWFVEFAKISWQLFRMAPITCIVMIILVILAIPAYKKFWKRVDEAGDPPYLF